MYYLLLQRIICYYKRIICYYKRIICYYNTDANTELPSSEIQVISTKWAI